MKWLIAVLALLAGIGIAEWRHRAPAPARAPAMDLPEGERLVAQPPPTPTRSLIDVVQDLFRPSTPAPDAKAVIANRETVYDQVGPSTKLTYVNLFTGEVRQFKLVIGRVDDGGATASGGFYDENGTIGAYRDPLGQPAY